ncbi:hypothetical protein HU200_056610 [Digitaria exilis]|uniref:Uncharacterized protein n=1 Tax=Digitaria exilis TaxID=1010633 RepID=A0A835AQP1_9POAL|nr:hypothetical protein HU200_056610 [Digitaria exilis]
MADVPSSKLQAYLSDVQRRGALAGRDGERDGQHAHVAGQAAGYAATDSVQALPLVSTFWGVVLFGEYRRSSRRTYTLLASMHAARRHGRAHGLLRSAHRKPL